MNLNYYFIKTPIGKLTAVEKDETVVYIGLPNSNINEIKKWCEKNLDYSDLNFIENPKTALKTQIDEYFAKERINFNVDYELFTTKFRERALNEVQKIPYGKTKSYSEIADQIDSPKAVRAVGSANSTNTLPIIIPCHRVINQNGKLGGYGGGLDMKIKLLELEGWNG